MSEPTIDAEALDVLWEIYLKACVCSLDWDTRCNCEAASMAEQALRERLGEDWHDIMRTKKPGEPVVLQEREWSSLGAAMGTVMVSLRQIDPKEITRAQALRLFTSSQTLERMAESFYNRVVEAEEAE